MALPRRRDHSYAAKCGCATAVRDMATNVPSPVFCGVHSFRRDRPADHSTESFASREMPSANTQVIPRAPLHTVVRKSPRILLPGLRCDATLRCSAAGGMHTEWSQPGIHTRAALSRNLSGLAIHR